jgi:hypothetical protein
MTDDVVMRADKLGKKLLIGHWAKRALYCAA